MSDKIALVGIKYDHTLYSPNQGKIKRVKYRYTGRFKVNVPNEMRAVSIYVSYYKAHYII